jgi:hypothetical protein
MMMAVAQSHLRRVDDVTAELLLQLLRDGHVAFNILLFLLALFGKERAPQICQQLSHNRWRKVPVLLRRTVSQPVICHICQWHRIVELIYLLQLVREPETGRACVEFSIAEAAVAVNLPGLLGRAESGHVLDLAHGACDVDPATQDLDGKLVGTEFVIASTFHNLIDNLGMNRDEDI